MSWLTDLISRPFAKAADKGADIPHLDPAHMMLTRHRLNDFAAEPDHEGAESFVSARWFLRAIEKNAHDSALNHLLGSSPQEIRKAARISLMNAVAVGQCPFFYKKENDKAPVYVEDMYVPVKHLAKHALSLMDNTKMVTLPGIYLNSLHDMESSFRSRTELADSWHLDYVDLKDDEGERFELGAADSRASDNQGGHQIQIVLRPRHKDGMQPS